MLRARLLSCLVGLFSWMGSSLARGRGRAEAATEKASVELSSATPFMTLLQLLFPHLPILRDSFGACCCCCCYGLSSLSQAVSAALEQFSLRNVAMALRASSHSASAHHHKKNTDYFKSAGIAASSSHETERSYSTTRPLQQKKGLSFILCQNTETYSIFQCIQECIFAMLWMPPIFSSTDQKSFQSNPSELCMKID